MFKPGFSYDRENQLLIDRYRSAITNFDNNALIVYDEVYYINKYVNSILIFNSLLGEFDYNSYKGSDINNKNMINYFIKYGIFRLDSFDRVWPISSAKILESEYMANNKSNDIEVHSHDFGALKFAFDQLYINYVIETVLEKEKYNVVANTDGGNQIRCNSEILSKVRHK